jgi:hypothetical protein
VKLRREKIQGTIKGLKDAKEKIMKIINKQTDQYIIEQKKRIIEEGENVWLWW